MFYYNNHASHSDEYVLNAKLVSVRRHYYNINTKTLEPEFRPIGVSYYYFFNRRGLLTEVIRRTGRNAARIIYTYNKKNKPICINSFDIVTHQLSRTIFLNYDEKDRIIQEVVYGSSFYQTEMEETDLYEHTYENNLHTVEFVAETTSEFKDVDDYDDWLIEETLNDCDQVIEFKYTSHLEGLHMWKKYQYSKYGELIHEMTLDEKGETNSEVFFEKDYRIINSNEEEDSLVFESKFEYNDKGHWVKEYILKNGIICSVVERDIEYYN